jgi:twitching motility protein PilU
LMNADSANNLRLKVKLEGLRADEALDTLLEKGNTGAGKGGLHIQGLQAGGRSFRKI